MTGQATYFALIHGMVMHCMVFATSMLYALPAHSLIPNNVLHFPSFGVKVYLSCMHRKMLNSTIMHTDICLRCLIPRI